MKIIFGLGNPGSQYEGTRHNAGFDLLDQLAAKAGLSFNKQKFKSLVAEGPYLGEKLVLIKPQTFMNLSGEAVVQALNFYKPYDEDWLVAYDDVALVPGQIRIRLKGSAGGHNGMKSIIGLTGSQDFIRLRIGVGAPRSGLVSHVLGKLAGEEKADYEAGLKLAVEALETFLKEGGERAMNRYNVKKKPQGTETGDKPCD